MKENKEIKLGKLLKKSQPNFWYYINKIEAQAKENGFLIKKISCKYSTLPIIFFNKTLLVWNFQPRHAILCFLQSLILTSVPDM